MSRTVFLSHATADRELAENIHLYFRQLGGIEVYLCEHDIQPGRSLADKVERGIQESEAVIVLLSPSSFQSAYVQQEIGFAKGIKKLVVPLMLKGTPPTRLGLLEGVEWIFIDPEDQNTSLSQVATYLEQHRKELETQSFAITNLSGADLQMSLALALFGIIAIILATFSDQSRRV